MKKGQMCEGIIEYIDFPNKGRVKVEDQYVTVKMVFPDRRSVLSLTKSAKTAVKADYWKYWRNLH